MGEPSQVNWYLKCICRHTLHIQYTYFVSFCPWDQSFFPSLLYKIAMAILIALLDMHIFSISFLEIHSIWTYGDQTLKLQIVAFLFFLFSLFCLPRITFKVHRNCFFIDYIPNTYCNASIHSHPGNFRVLIASALFFYGYVVFLFLCFVFWCGCLLFLSFAHRSDYFFFFVFFSMYALCKLF